MNDNIEIKETVDILEDRIPRSLLKILLFDHTTGKNILWGTDIGHTETDEILLEDIIGENGMAIRPRVKKSEEEKKIRTKKRAEVFTPAWVCNEQLNAVDHLWFYGSATPSAGSPFNSISGQSWNAHNEDYIKEEFEKTGKDWKKYILEDKIEMCCGEGPYLMSRYDVVTERVIPVEERIGILDRKLRVASAFATNKAEWVKWAIKAYQHTYGFEWQGDNLLLTRETLLYGFIENLKLQNLKFALKRYKKEHRGSKLTAEHLFHVLNIDSLNIEDFEIITEICKIISWNIWQMDGTSGCTPYTQPPMEMRKLINQINKDPDKVSIPNEYCKIMDWDEKKITSFIEVYAEAVRR